MLISFSLQRLWISDSPQISDLLTLGLLAFAVLGLLHA